MKRYFIQAIERRLSSLVIAVLIVTPLYLNFLNHWIDHQSFMCLLP
jgi:integral membrane sensor domain MASE1